MILHAMLWLSHMGRVLARKPRHVLPSLHETPPPHTHTHLKTQQDKELRRSATRILGLLAEVSPRAVLPGVHAHFVAALETVTSTSVLASAIQTLSLCVRPLLVAGLVLPPEDGGGGVEVAVGMNGDGEVPGGADAARATAGASLAAALMATVPGIDANDPPKSLAVFRFYAIVLSSLAQLPVWRGGVCVRRTNPVLTTGSAS